MHGNLSESDKRKLDEIYAKLPEIRAALRLGPEEIKEIRRKTIELSALTLNDIKDPISTRNPGPWYFL